MATQGQGGRQSGGNGGNGGNGRFNAGSGGSGANGGLVSGGAIYSLGGLLLSNCTFSGNSVQGGNGGAGGGSAGGNAGSTGLRTQVH